MDWVYELACTGAANRMGDADRLGEPAAPAWLSLPRLAALDLYRPIAAARMIRSTMTGPGRCSSPCWRSGSRGALTRRSASAEFALSLGGRPSGPRLDRLELRAALLSGRRRDRARPLTAPFSYVVRYHKPAEDEAAFIRNYVDTHPPTLGKLPGIRAVMCYFPQAIAAPGVRPPTT